eukprot:CAMPEP_0201520856 /NCGR_PEP_ID=MMETSP0161_2-20130828/12939_1 /ASSEMBLY_ACC=CAM_ASM_000251 /TAXON_ID=180227 /ORGANISM="Neoparamoeba aestuarina, Strain SoJaBio B1-5/56/2" /LENGTH=331 /DNA_ID=CAMNT_0047919365 /DNA_START=32 /DNA_END=1028 /DNA_ORIENTATION=+
MDEMDTLNCFFGIEVDKTKPQKVTPELGFLHISQAALATPAPGKATLRIATEGKTFTVGTLSAEGGMYHMPLDINFMPGAEVEFSVVGDGNTTVHITGYYEMDDDDDLDESVDIPSDEEEEEDDEDIPATKQELVPPIAKEQPVPAKPIVTAPESDDSSDDEEDEEGEELSSSNEGSGEESESDMEEDEEEMSENTPEDSDDESSVEDDMPAKKGKGHHGNTFTKPQENKGHSNKGFDNHHKRDREDRDFHGKRHHSGGDADEDSVATSSKADEAATVGTSEAETTTSLAVDTAAGTEVATTDSTEVVTEAATGAATGADSEGDDIKPIIE